ncbi:polysaccharide deacetylase [Nakamurella antarctica]|uniref:Polysaccharide deacetylase n=1 Tax=Nakamurella antarctica TaxID=1902245 RepID=A0A3G8ZJ38_9ACTN|nr:polysaccharide deacetylase [Nakamurella antarctica]AZI57283.1 polysaccharide deacetylase [Nakamurella antarctica]
MKHTKWLVLGLVLALVAVTGVLIYQNRSTDTSAAGSDLVTETVVVTPTAELYGKPSADGTESLAPDAPTSVPGTSISPVPASPSATPASSATPEVSAAPSSLAPGQVPADGSRKPTNIPMTKLKPGEKAPQFIIFSFDGVGSSEKINAFMDAAAPTNSRMDGFLTDLYLLTDDKADLYTAPGGTKGKAAAGFGGDAAEVIKRVNDLNKFYALGNEVGTHYNGHFCELGANWSTDQWNNEIDQAMDFFQNWKKLDNLPDAPDLAIPVSEIKGGRTPCLAGRFDQLTPAWKKHGWTYDSSGENKFTGIAWPQQEDGIWQFPIPTVYSPGFDVPGWKNPLVKAMDYNFWAKFNNAVNDPSSQPQMTKIVADTYSYMYDQAYNGNRAPVIVANHFNNWNGNSFNPAALQFMSEKCGQPDTYCATFGDVISWMQLQDPAVLKSLQDAAPVAAGP